MYVELTLFDVLLASALILINGAISVALKLGMGRTLLIASFRTIVQLLLIGTILKWVFSLDRWYAVAAIVAVMTVVAALSAVGRCDRRYPGMAWDSILSVGVSAWATTLFALTVILRQVEPWYQAQYAIPLAGMILGNSLNGISLSLNRLAEELTAHRDQVETLLALGATRWEAARGSVRQAVRTGTIPIVNSMMVVGIVSLPGMMTGQLLSGTDPLQAVRYQIVIMFLIASATALGAVGVTLLSFRRLFNRNHQFESWRIRG